MKLKCKAILTILGIIAWFTLWLDYIIISYWSSSSAHHSPLLDIGLSNFSPYRSIFDYSHPTPASRPAQIVTPPGLRASYTTFTETRSPLQYSFTSTVVGSTADMASPLPLQRANTVCYVGNFSSLPYYLVSDSIPQGNPEHSFFHSSLIWSEYTVDMASPLPLQHANTVNNNNSYWKHLKNITKWVPMFFLERVDLFPRNRCLCICLRIFFRYLETISQAFWYKCLFWTR
jgi:hypothetical protein